MRESRRPSGSVYVYERATHMQPTEYAEHSSDNTHMECRQRRKQSRKLRLYLHNSGHQSDNQRLRPWSGWRMRYLHHAARWNPEWSCQVFDSDARCDSVKITVHGAGSRKNPAPSPT